MRFRLAAGLALMCLLLLTSPALAGTDVSTWCASNGRDTFHIAEEESLLRYDRASGEWRGCLDRTATALVWIDDGALYFLSDPEGGPIPENWLDERGWYSTLRYDLATGQTSTLIAQSMGKPRCDGRFLYWLSAPNRISRCDMNGQGTRVLVQLEGRIPSFQLSGGCIVTASGAVYDAEGREQWGAMGIPPDEIPFTNGSAQDYRMDARVNGVRIKRLMSQQWIDGDQPICFADDGLYTVRYNEDPDRQAVAEANEIWFYGGDAAAPRLVGAYGFRQASDLNRIGGRLYLSEPSAHDFLTVYELDEDSGDVLASFPVDGEYTRTYQAGGQLFFYDPTAGYDIWFERYSGVYNPSALSAHPGAMGSAGGPEEIRPAEEAAPDEGDPDERAPLILDYDATSTLDDDRAYRAENAFDGDIATAWSEGAAGSGAGEGLYVIASRHATLTGFSIYGGYGKSKDTYKRNARVKRLTIYADSEKIQTFTLKDERKAQRFTLDEPAEGLVFLFQIDTVYPGSRYEDACISELSPMIE